MANRRLSQQELVSADELLGNVRRDIQEASHGDDFFLFALRRKIYKELIYDERGKPAHRRRLKQMKRKEQGGICPICQETLPEKYVVLDRYEAMIGYTSENTRLIHQHCDRTSQESRGYS